LTLLTLALLARSQLTGAQLTWALLTGTGTARSLPDRAAVAVVLSVASVTLTVKLLAGEVRPVTGAVRQRDSGCKSAAE
jgi:hypothetical protein